MLFLGQITKSMLRTNGFTTISRKNVEIRFLSGKTIPFFLFIFFWKIFCMRNAGSILNSTNCRTRWNRRENVLLGLDRRTINHNRYCIYLKHKECISRYFMKKHVCYFTQTFVVIFKIAICQVDFNYFDFFPAFEIHK